MVFFCYVFDTLFAPRFCLWYTFLRNLVRTRHRQMLGDQLLLKTDVIVEALHPDHPQKVILFGSWAPREADEESDLDLI